jgi:hypothetical protein
VKANPDALHRLVRAATGLGIFAEVADGKVVNTALGECLRSNVPGSMRDFLLAELSPGHWLPWGKLTDAVRQGQPQTQATLGMPVWEYYAKHQDEGVTFARGMGNLSAGVSAQCAGTFDAKPYARIVDVGGSQGILLQGLLRGAPASKGVLFDMPNIVESARPVVAQSGLADRIEIVGGDFFKEVPAGGDLYVLKSIVHDWDDERALTILKNVHRAARPGSRMLLVETLLPERTEPTPVNLMDLNMLVMLGGRERKAGEFAALCARAGYQMEKVTPMPGLFNLLEFSRQG